MSESISTILLSKYQTNQIDHEIHESDKSESVSDDELFDLLENDEKNGFNAYRAERLQQLSKQMENIKSQVEKGYGSVNICTNETELIRLLENTPFLLVHFTNNQFETCQIMHEKLELIARKHINTRVLEIEAENSPFLTSKMNIKVLPFVVGYAHGSETLRLTGFEQLGNSSKFTLRELETVVSKAGLIDLKDIDLNVEKNGKNRWNTNSAEESEFED